MNPVSDGGLSPNPERQSVVVERLRRFVRTKQISQRRVAARIGISQGTLSRILSEEPGEIRQSTLDQIAAALATYSGELPDSTPDTFVDADLSYDVFLSHNGKDKPAVRELKRLLSANGLGVWLDEDELRPGIPWQQLLEESIKTSASVAVLIGKDGLGPWKDEEMQGALRLAVKDKRPVIPVLLPGASAQPKMPSFLTNRTWADLRAGLTQDGLAKLIWGITGKKQDRIEKALSASSKPVTDVAVSPTRLRHGAEHLFGRDTELAELDEAWNNPATQVLTIVAWGGVGKTSLVFEWMARRSAAGWPGFERVFDWSFYSQGTREQGVASADAFVAKALEFFGDRQMAKSAASPWDKGARLAQLVAGRRTLLVLDGLEPLQHPPGPLGGQLKDPALEALLMGLALHNPGLCLLTTRQQLTDLAPFRQTTAPQWDLEDLSEEAGAALLHRSGATRAGPAAIKQDDPELRAASREVEGHALTLRLLGSYLALAEEGNVRKRDSVTFADADRQFRTGRDGAEEPYGHAFKVMAACERWLATGGDDGARQLAVLRLLGLFDRPASAGCLTALRESPAIAGLTEPLVGLSDANWTITLKRLADCGLISVQSEQSAIRNRQSAIDAHPLIREYFAKQLREKNLEGWRAAHRWLYEHLTGSTEHQPDTLEGLQPLYQAVAHGCQAGLHQEACDEVYHDRIQRGKEAYSTNKLGAIGADLGAVACFFEQPWSRVSPALSEGDQAWLLNEAAFRLRALGRLTEALEPMRAGLPIELKWQDWKNAAIRASNLSELALTLGEVPGAVGDAEQSVIFADRSGDSFWRLVSRTTLADALHQAGRRADAQERFREAEAMQAEHQPQYPLLYSQSGFQYCDLLLSGVERAAWRCGAGFQAVTDHRQEAGATPMGMLNHGQDVRATLIARCREVEQRAAKTLKWAEEFAGAPLLDIAHNHLTLGRAAFYRAVLEEPAVPNPQSAIEQLTAAVDGLRRAGTMDHLPRGLLSRAWLRFLEGDADASRRDLDDAWQIAERGPMRLFMADVHLHRARLFHAEKPYPWTSPKDDLAQARALIERCGYHHRDEELADAEQAAKSW